MRYSVLLGFCLALFLVACGGDGISIEKPCPGSPPPLVLCPGLDQSFGIGGWTVLDSTTGGEPGWVGIDTEIDGSGRIVVAGSSRGNWVRDMRLWRFDDTGALDSTFGVGGSVVHPMPGGVDDYAVAVVIDGSGRILAAGRGRGPGSGYDVVVWRVDSSGALDPSFGAGGVAVYDHNPGMGADDWATALALDAGGNILVAGSTRPTRWDHDTLLLRLDPAGDLDPSFGTGGVIAQDFSGGTNLSDYARDVIVDSSGRILLTGHLTSDLNRTGTDLVVWRFDPSGVLDPSFGNGGLATYDRSMTSLTVNEIGYALALDAIERIIVAGTLSPVPGSGWSTDAALWRFDPSGVLDQSFGAFGVVLQDGAVGKPDSEDAAFSVAVDASGRILAGGQSTFAFCTTDMVVWRFDDRGTLDPTFGCQGVFTHNPEAGHPRSSSASSIEIDRLGRIIAVGAGSSSDFGINLTLWRLLQ
ncbi:MAG: hypothetical protein O7H41_12515 [Planctomycetota bacterium]|nr:hypothetical protein [Planctomycetota bacterium]